MVVCTLVERQHQLCSTQPGSVSKRWDRSELLRCRATGTTEQRTLDLSGEIHPVFTNWAHASNEEGDALHKELKQPLLLASKILEAVGLPWLSDFFIDDLFDETYPGHCGFRVPPQAVARHHRAAWAQPEVKQKWLDDTRGELSSGEFAQAVEWQLDDAMFSQMGWVGYTCRHPRAAGMELDELDCFDTIAESDRQARSNKSQGRKKKKYRDLSVLVMAEFPARLRELRSQGKEGCEEYLLTAFMAAVTILHELGHVVYWKDQRCLARDLREPFYGADLEMELGDSFVASIFGGWVPVPIEGVARPGQGLAFGAGIAWRQSLSWDHHRIRPKYRAHYSIPVDYVSGLFREESWSLSSDLKKLVQPQTLASNESLALKTVGLILGTSHRNEHATAALADFRRNSEGWVWNRRPGARFRILQYDGYLCPEIDLPVATDDVVREHKLLPPPSPPPAEARTTVSARNYNNTISQQVQQQQLVASPRQRPRIVEIKSSSRKSATASLKIKPPSVLLMNLSPKEEVSKKGLYSHPAQVVSTLSPERSEISVDELKKRLSQLIGVSISELERLFETSRYSQS